MAKLPKKQFHLVFSFIMGAMMFFVMTFIVTAVNVDFPPDFVPRWLKSFAVAYVAGVPLIYFLGPIARRLSGRFAETP